MKERLRTVNNKVVAIAAFAIGVVVGAAATWKFAKTKYEKIADEEIESVKEVFSRKIKDQAQNNMSDLKDIVHELNYDSKKEQKNEEGEPVPEIPDDIYYISPDELGDYDQRPVVSLMYFADGVLATDDDEAIDEEDIPDFVPSDFADHFGEYEDDSVFVRDDLIKTDYEILLDSRNFSDVIEGIERDDE